MAIISRTGIGTKHRDSFIVLVVPFIYDQRLGIKLFRRNRTRKVRETRRGEERFYLQEIL